MASCSSCGRQLSFFENLQGWNTHRCPNCQQRLTQLCQQWSSSIEAAFARDGVSQELEQSLHRSFQETRMPPDLGNSVVERLKYLRRLSDIRWGHVPIIRVDIHLDSDEHAHFAMSATYYKPTKQVKPVPGRLVGTNKKCYFLSHTGKDSVTLDWNNLSKVEMSSIQVPATSVKVKAGQRVPMKRVAVIHLTVSRGAGGGSYNVADSLYTKIMMDTLVRIWKRQLVLYKEQATHGAIPEHVKAAVFQRDGGKCIQCGYSGDYIEYDHRIPRSKGGPNTVENIQLLCRKCNLQKGDRL